MTEPTRDDLLRENERLRERLRSARMVEISTSVGSIGGSIARYGLGGYFGYLMVKELAGKATVLTADVKAAVDVCKSISDAIAPAWWLVVGAVFTTIVLFKVNKRLRQSNAGLNKRIGECTKRYEQLIDARRSSSGMGPDGQVPIPGALP